MHFDNYISCYNQHSSKQNDRYHLKAYFANDKHNNIYKCYKLFIIFMTHTFIIIIRVFFFKTKNYALYLFKATTNNNTISKMYGVLTK